MNYVKRLLFWTWCLLQTLLGWLIFVFMFLTDRIVKTDDHKGTIVVMTNHNSWGVSLGQFIFLGEAYTQKTIKHEYGHTLQGFIFGPLYLIVIGIPSVTRNIIDRIFKFGSKWYYSGYPEKWADKLGRVEREEK